MLSSEYLSQQVPQSLLSSRNEDILWPLLEKKLGFLRCQARSVAVITTKYSEPNLQMSLHFSFPVNILIYSANPRL